MCSVFCDALFHVCDALRRVYDVLCHAGYVVSHVPDILCRVGHVFVVYMYDTIIIFNVFNFLCRVDDAIIFDVRIHCL